MLHKPKALHPTCKMATTDRYADLDVQVSNLRIGSSPDSKHSTYAQRQNIAVLPLLFHLSYIQMFYDSMFLAMEMLSVFPVFPVAGYNAR